MNNQLLVNIAIGEKSIDHNIDNIITASVVETSHGAQALYLTLEPSRAEACWVEFGRPFAPEQPILVPESECTPEELNIQ